MICRRVGGEIVMTKRLTLLLLFFASPLWATTYYVDNCVAVGSDRNDGTSPSTSRLPKKQRVGLQYAVVQRRKELVEISSVRKTRLKEEVINVVKSGLPLI